MWATSIFSASHPWDISYSFGRCPGLARGFAIDVLTRDGAMADHDVVQGSGTSASGTAHELLTGEFQLRIISGCPWHVAVTSVVG